MGMELLSLIQVTASVMKTSVTNLTWLSNSSGFLKRRKLISHTKMLVWRSFSLDRSFHDWTNGNHHALVKRIKQIKRLEGIETNTAEALLEAKNYLDRNGRK